MANISLAYPWFLLLLLLLPILWWHHKKIENKVVIKMRVPSIGNSTALPKTGRVKYRKLPLYFRLITLAVLIVALSRPQKPLGSTPLSIEGIDIVLALDISGSMLAQDLKPDRLQAAIQVAKEFIAARPNDRIGYVIFAGESFTQSPLTIDHKSLNTLLDNTRIDLLEDGTAIGMGLATAVNRLKDSEASSKVIILMTDGDNNSGYIDPHTAIAMAKTEQIRTYTIGIGRNGTAPFPIQNPFTGAIVYQDVEVVIDEELLQLIASETEGIYYRAESNNDLSDIYKEIDRLEKSKIEVSAFTPKKELFFPILVVGMVLLLIEWCVSTVYLKQNI
ncbi:MAG TPA: VWA domain-containing protein [Chitinophagales bacterium]|nr:VWA domain-containing protein [Chitinophagales bacterium]